MLGPFATTSRLTPIHQMSLAVRSRAACASMSTTTTTTTTRDRGDRNGPKKVLQWHRQPPWLPNTDHLIVFARWRSYLPPSNIRFLGQTRVCPAPYGFSIFSNTFCGLTRMSIVRIAGTTYLLHILSRLHTSN